MAIKQLNGINIILIERKDEFIYNSLVSDYVSEHIDGMKTNSNFLKVNPAEIEPTTITKFIMGGLQGKINKLLILQCSDLKVLEHKMGNSKVYKGRIPTLFDELCRILPKYRNVKVIISVSEIIKTSKIFKKIDSDGKVILHTPMGLRQYISFVNKRCKQYNIKMDNDVVKYMLGLIENNCAIIDSELKKLSLLGLEVITRDIVRTNVMKSKNIIVFELIKTIGARRYNASINLLCELLEQGVSPLQIVVLMQRNFRVLFHIHCKSNMAEFKLNKWSEKSYKEQSSRFTLEEIVNILNELLWTEKQLKSSSIDEAFLLYMLIFEII